VDDVSGVEIVEQWIERTRLPSDSAEWVENRQQVLAAFLDSIDKSAEEIVAYCFLRKRETGERFVSTKRRGQVNAWIDTFAEESGWEGKEQVANANIIRSFLIHSGVPIGGSRTWTGG